MNSSDCHLIAYKAGVSRHNNITADKTTPQMSLDFNNAASLDTQPTLRFIAPNIDSNGHDHLL